VLRGGPLDERTVRLVKLGIAIGAKPSALLARTPARSLAGQVRPEELRHVGLLALTTIGFPHTAAGLSWIEEVIESTIASSGSGKRVPAAREGSGSGA
jgi:hypothetical protein